MITQAEYSFCIKTTKNLAIKVNNSKPQKMQEPMLPILVWTQNKELKQ